MENLELIFSRAQTGDYYAFGKIVQRFQDMAVGYAYSILRDFHLAEDAAQEAFIEAYAGLSKVYGIAAFPAWLRRIVFKHCNRFTRRKSLETVPLDDVMEPHSGAAQPLAEMEAEEEKIRVLAAIAALSEHHRQAVTLFYISGYSQKQLADFLQVPQTTINSRLQAARGRLKELLSEERIIPMVKKTLQENAPSQDSQFTDKVRRMIQPISMKTTTYVHGVDKVDGNDAWELMQACVAGDLTKVNALLEKDPCLVNAQFWYQFPIHMGVREGHADIVKLLLDAGADAGQSRFMYNSWNKLLDTARERGHNDVHTLLESAMKDRFNYAPEFEDLKEAIVSRDSERVESVLRAEPNMACTADAFGNNTIHWAVMTRQLSLIDRFLELGGDINAQRADGKTPALLSLTGDYQFKEHRDLTDAAIRLTPIVTGYLLGKGAEYNLSIAVAIGDRERVEEILAGNSDLASQLDSARHSPLFYAARSGYTEIVGVLLDHGADPNRPEELAPSGRALFEACAGNHLKTAKLLLERGANPNAGVDSCGCCLTIVEYNHPNACAEMQTLLQSHGAQKPPYAMSAKELKAALRKHDRFVIEHEEFMRCVLEKEDVIRVLVETHPEFVTRANDGVLWSNTHPNSRETLQLLVEHGFDPNKSDWVGKTFLHACAESGDTESAAAFLEFGADINAIELENGETPLASASRKGHVEMARFLLEQGADPNLADGHWATPLARTKKEEHTEIVEMLHRHGARK